MGSINETYRISALFDHKYKVMGWYAAIHKENFKWKLTRNHGTREKAILEALDLIREDVEK